MSKISSLQPFLQRLFNSESRELLEGHKILQVEFAKTLDYFEFLPYVKISNPNWLCKINRSLRLMVLPIKSSQEKRF